MNNITISQWNIEANEYNENSQKFYESIFCQGNGHIGVRGFPKIDGQVKPDESGNYIAGFFEHIKSNITDMVNLPDGFSTQIFVNDKIVSLDNGKIEEYKINFDLRNGLLTRSIVYVDKQNNRTFIKWERFISWANIHNGCLRVTVKSLTGKQKVTIVSGINANIANRPISDNQLGDNSDVLCLFNDPQILDGGLSGQVTMISKPSQRTICEAFNLDVKANDFTVNTHNDKKYVGAEVVSTIKENEEIVVDKFVSIYCFSDSKRDLLESAKLDSLNSSVNGFDKELELSKIALQSKWDVADIVIEGKAQLQGALRYCIMQLFQTNDCDNDKVSIGARGIMHGRYKGCYFWDTEIFMLPFYLYTNPTAAKNLLMYRYNTLRDAKTSAGWFSLKGARYSWMCSDTGFEQCETWDTGCCEIHITADIAYAINNYFTASNDKDFLFDYGCEMLIETARYWQSRFSYDKNCDIFNLLFVKGPDEYCGVTTNNTYTNYLARFNLINAIKSIELLKQSDLPKWQALEKKLNISQEEIDAWSYMIPRIKINYDEKRQLFIQDDTFEKLEDLDIKKYKVDDSPLYRVISFDRLQRYKVLKQGDLVMLMLLLPNDFSKVQKQNVWDYYEPLTLHDSTLSFGSHAVMASNLGEMDKAEKYFYKSMYLDLFDVMNNTAVEGVHTASFGSAWQAMIFGYCGLIFENGKPNCKPHLPEDIKSVKFKVIYQGKKYQLNISNQSQKIEEV